MWGKFCANIVHPHKGYIKSLVPVNCAILNSRLTCGKGIPSAAAYNGKEGLIPCLSWRFARSCRISSESNSNFL